MTRLLLPNCVQENLLVFQEARCDPEDLSDLMPSTQENLMALSSQTGSRSQQPLLAVILGLLQEEQGQEGLPVAQVYRYLHHHGAVQLPPDEPQVDALEHDEASLDAIN